MKFPNPVAAVIFDMDGLLLDTERIYAAAIMSAGRAVGFEISEALCHDMIGIPAKECDLMVQDRYGNAFPLREYQRECDAQLAALLEAGIPLKSGAIELVDHVSKSGLPKAIATSSSRRTATRHLQKSGLLDRFDIVITRDDVQHGKPNPEPYSKAAAALGVEPDRCLSLEDSLNGVRSAYAAGTMPIMVPDILMPTDEARAMCVAIVQDLHQVRRMLSA